MKKILALIIIVLAGIFVWQIYHESPQANHLALPDQPAPVVTKTVTPQIEVSEEKKSAPVIIIDQVVPFTAQAPFGDWDDDRQQDGCEEASALMAMRWVHGEALNRLAALSEIKKISDYEKETYSEYRDIALEDVVDWIFKDYFKYDKVSVEENIQIIDIINELQAGHLVIAPMDGQKLGNPYFTQPGPERHMLVIRGYDSEKKEFITNDPGTKRGESYRYDQNILFAAIRAYPTGYHVPIEQIEKSIIIVSK